jgi:hypothetical protein
MFAVILAILAALTPPAVTFAAAEMDWGFRGAFRSYVHAGTGAPPITASAGATCVPNPDTARGGCDPKIGTAAGVFGWTATVSSYVLPSGAGTIDMQGTVTFSRPDHFFLLSLIDPIVTIEDGGGALVNARVVLTIIPPFTGESVDERLDLGEYTLASPVQASPATVTWSLGNGMITAEAAEALGGFLSAGADLDPIRIVLPIGTTTSTIPTGGSTSTTVAIPTSTSTSTTVATPTTLPLTVDHPQAAQKLVVSAKRGKQKLVWVTKTPPVVLPSADPSVTGAVLEVRNPITREGGAVSLPASSWSPGTTGKVRKFFNGGAPGGTSVVKVATVKRDKSLKVAARGTIVTLDEASQGALEIVLTINADRYCAACSTPTKDVAGLFVAKGCPAPAGCP